MQYNAMQSITKFDLENMFFKNRIVSVLCVHITKNTKKKHQHSPLYFEWSLIKYVRDESES
jgi:hypothetical protein